MEKAKRKVTSCKECPLTTVCPYRQYTEEHRNQLCQVLRVKAFNFTHELVVEILKTFLKHHLN